MNAHFTVTTFYKFVDLSDEGELLQQQLSQLPGLKGLIIVAPEGLNGTVCGYPRAVAGLRTFFSQHPKFDDLDYKDSFCENIPFPRWKVELKEQTIMYKEGYSPKSPRRHLSAEQWHRLLQSGQPVTVLDTRNTYETDIGIFKNAIDPRIETFTEFSDYLAQCELPKEQTTLIYCTGGIRCEKAIIDMEERGFKNVYQLQGGILKYLEEFPNQEFEGECFVFDKRVAVDQHLAPSERYWLCPHCGNPGDLEIACCQCGEETHLCRSCFEKEPTCSKDCAYHRKRLAEKAVASNTASGA